MKVLGSFVLLERVNNEASDFIIPDDQKDTFKVVGVGPEATDVKKGDEVVAIEHYQGEVDLAGKKVIVVRRDDIVVVL